MSTPTPQSFLVWFDPFFEEWFACPKNEATDRLMEALGQMHALPKEVEASTIKEAISLCKPQQHPDGPSSLPPDAFDELHAAPHPVIKIH